MQTTPFWTEQFLRPDDLPIGENIPNEVDVAIVGSGYTGLNAARVFAQSGAQVAVLERNTIGWGASSRNGGMATPGIKQSLKEIIRRYGKAKGREFWQASLDAIYLLEQLILDELLDCDWERKGHIALAYKPAHFEHLRKVNQWYKDEFGYETILVAPSDLRTEIGTHAFYGGLSNELSGGLQPANYVFGLAYAVARHGAHLCEHTDVTHIERNRSGF